MHASMLAPRQALPTILTDMHSSWPYYGSPWACQSLLLMQCCNASVGVKVTAAAWLLIDRSPTSMLPSTKAICHALYKAWVSILSK